MKRPGQLTAMISSTAADLPEHREQAGKACLRAGIFPIGMELLPARDADGIRVSLEMVDQADIYIGIYAWRYGWVPDFDNPGQISVTEMEFNYALERKKDGQLKEILIFVMDDDHPTTRKDVEADAVAQEKLKKFKERAAAGRVRLTFKSAEELRGHVLHSLLDAQKRIEAAHGGIPAAPNFHPPNLIPHPPEPYIAHPYSLLQTKDVVGRQAELNLLTDWVTTNNLVPADTRIFNLVAIGGMGKSALTWKWFNDIAPNEMPHLAGRLWWSFYESDAHWENFLIRALAYVSRQPEEAVRKLSYPDRETQLHRILDQQPFLLCLDGLERILLAYARMDAAQLPDDDLDDKTANHVWGRTGVSPVSFGVPPNAPEEGRTAASAVPPGASPGDHHPATAKHRLRLTADHRAGQFLKRLTRVRSSRILISTRLYPTDLQAETGDPLPGCFAYSLTGLNDSDALNLWREFKITGSTEQLLPIFRSFGNYPLLIRALAGEIANFRPAPRDFDEWKTVNRDFNPTILPLINARTHVLSHSLCGLGENQRKVLHTISAFRMPATWNTLHSLLVENKAGSPLLTVPQAGNTPPTSAHRAPAPDSATSTRLKPCTTDRDLDSILTELEDRGLVGWDKKSNRYDLHPIVRGVVWQGLNGQLREAIYTDLYSYFDAVQKPPSWEKIETLEDLASTIELYHSLLGLGRFDDAFVLFFKHLEHATHWRLSANRQRAELLEHLFSDDINMLPRLLSPLFQAGALNALALAYLNLGEPGRSAPLLFRAVKICESHGSQTNLGNSLGNLSNALSDAGGLFTAITVARSVLRICPNIMEKFYEGRSYMIIGHLLSICGVESNSHKALNQSLAIWIQNKNRQCQGLTNAYLAERLLWLNRPKSATQFAQRAWELARVDRDERDFIRAARLCGTAALGVGDLSTASDRLQHAVARARAVNHVEEELRTLTGLAELHRRKGELGTAGELLDQVWDLAERGPYPLFHADALNVLAQIERDEGHRDAAIAAAAKAYTLAWCDGISADGKTCYAYHYGLTNARRHLRELGTPEPQLPPFDPSKFEPMPDVDINPKDEFWVDPANLDSL